MPLRSAALVSTHFTAAELGADKPSASSAIVANLSKLASYLEALRAVLGVPLRVTSGYRSPDENAEVGGVASSDHVVGLAADVVPLGVEQYAAYQQIEAAVGRGTLPAWDQLIFYPVQGHLHVGIGERQRRELRVALAEGGYPLLTAETVRQLRGFV